MSPSEQIFQQQQAERQQFQQQLQQIPQAQQQPIPKKALILGLISDALSAGSGSGSSNVLGQLKARTERQFEIDSRKMKLQFDILNTQHRDRLAAFDDFFELQQEKRAGNRESRAQAQEKTRLDLEPIRRRQAEANAKIAELNLDINTQTKDAKIKAAKNNADASALNLRIAEKRFLDSQANDEAKKELEAARTKNDLTEEKLRESIIQNMIKEERFGDLEELVINGRISPKSIQEGNTELEQFHNFMRQTEQAGPELLMNGDKLEALPESIKQKGFENFQNEKDLQDSEQDGVLYNFRKDINNEVFSLNNIHQESGSNLQTPGFSDIAFFIDKKDRDIAWADMIKRLASPTVTARKSDKLPVELDIPQLQWMLISHGKNKQGVQRQPAFSVLNPENDLIVYLSTFFPEKLSDTGVVLNQESSKILFQAVNKELRSQGKKEIKISDIAERAIQEVAPALKDVGSLGRLGLSGFSLTGG